MALTAVLAGCTPTATNMGEGVAPKQLPGYHQSYATVFNAVGGAAEMLGWRIRDSDHNAGLIRVHAPATAWKSEEWISIEVFRADSADGDPLVHVGFRAVGELATPGQKDLMQRFYRQLDAALNRGDSTVVAR
ncbi:MAG: hypothetical protein ACREND_08115 [Gemmatimonadaceae bacterium]